MKIVLAEPRLFKESISMISGLVNEVTMHVSKDMINITAMDPANVALVTFQLLAPACIEYSVEKDEDLTVSLDGLNHVLRRAKPSDIMSLELDKKKSRLAIKLVGSASKTFHLALLDNVHKEQKIPDLEFPVKINLPSLVFNESIEDMSIASESVLFSASVQSFSMTSESRLNSAKVEFSTENGLSVESAKKENTISKYSLEYLNKIAKGSKLADNMTLQFGDEYPLKVDYKIIDKLNLSVILAPRVMND